MQSNCVRDANFVQPNESHADAVNIDNFCLCGFSVKGSQTNCGISNEIRIFLHLKLASIEDKMALAIITYMEPSTQHNGIAEPRIAFFINSKNVYIMIYR